MKTACDANVLLLTVLSHIREADGRNIRIRACRKIIADRDRLGLHLPETAVGEIFEGIRWLEEIDVLVGYLERIPLIEGSYATRLRAARLRRLLGRGEKALKDCNVYVEAASASCDILYSDDKGFTSGRNRERIPELYEHTWHEPAPSLQHPEELIMSNPPRPRRRRTSGTDPDQAYKDAMKKVRAWKARARRRAKAAGCKTEMDIIKYYAQSARIHLGHLYLSDNPT